MVLRSRIGYVFLLHLICFSSYAAPAVKAKATAFPRGCTVSGFGYQGPELILNQDGEQTYYLIQNRSDFTVEMQKPKAQDDFMDPPLFALMKSKNWSAFASDVANFRFKCYKQENENQSVELNCQDVLEVCQYPRAKFPVSNYGNYWITTNNTQGAVIRESAAKGIYLRW
jgi:hypothetical protein